MIRGYNEGLIPQRVKHGAIAGVPYLCVNAFSKSQFASESEWSKCRAFFLTHYDDGILQDSLNSNFLEKLSESPDESLILFMHKLCYNYLIYYTTTFIKNEKILNLLQHLRFNSKIIFLQKNERVRLIFGEKSKNKNEYIVDVTPLSAGHNAGSLMLLIEPHPQGEGGGDENEERVLYTGNCRLTIDDLKNCQPLFHKCGAKKSITELYIDTTYCVRHVKELPARSVVEEKLMAFMNSEMGPTSYDVRFQFWTPTDIGGFHYLRRVFIEFQESIHTPRNLSTFLEQLPSCNDWTQSNEGPNSLFHYCCGLLRKNSECSNEDFNEEFDVLNICLQCDMFRTPVFATEDEIEWTAHGHSIYVRKPDIFRAIYSSHLSRFELGRMVNFLGVSLDKVRPIYRPKFMTLEILNTLIKQTCEDVNKQAEPGNNTEIFFSQEYDFTGKNLTRQEIYKRKPVEYFIDLELDLNFESEIPSNENDKNQNSTDFMKTNEFTSGQPTQLKLDTNSDCRYPTVPQSPTVRVPKTVGHRVIRKKTIIPPLSA